MSKPPALQELHEAILGRVKPFDKDEAQFMKMMTEIGFGNYNPHITLSKDDPGKLKKKYIGRSFEVASYELLRKKDGVWLPVKTFPLG